MIVSITAQKGGTGKTTTAAALGAGLTQKKYNTLLVDLDAQGSLSSITGADRTALTMLEVLKGETAAPDAIQHLDIGDIIPATKSLVGAEALLLKRPYTLKEKLEPIAGEYDFIIIDTPPALGPMTINAMTASNLLIIPTQADVLNMEGLQSIYGSFQYVQRVANPALKIGGILLTKHNNRAVIRRDLEEVLRTKTAPEMGTKVYKTTIREGVAIQEAQYMKESIFKYAPKSKPAQDYTAFIKEFIKNMKEG